MGTVRERLSTGATPCACAGIGEIAATAARKVKPAPTRVSQPEAKAYSDRVMPAPLPITRPRAVAELALYNTVYLGILYCKRLRRGREPRPATGPRSAAGPRLRIVRDVRRAHSRSPRSLRKK